jgi:hypothetical protein
MELSASGRTWVRSPELPQTDRHACPREAVIDPVWRGPDRTGEAIERAGDAPRVVARSPHVVARPAVIGLFTAAP